MAALGKTSYVIKSRDPSHSNERMTAVLRIARRFVSQFVQFWRFASTPSPTLHAKPLSEGLADLAGGMAVGAGKPAIESGQIVETAVDRNIEDRAFRKPDQEIATAP